MTDKEYARLVGELSPRSPCLKNCAWAFCVGGLICVIGQLFLDGFQALGLDKKDAATAMCMSLIALSGLLTGLSLYDDIAKHAGAGTLVPITGFANAVVAPAVEFKTEGFILGVGAKMFTIAGPVIVYGTVASVVYGVIYWATTLF
ncbi:MAG: stage V sporulation protein AC [Ruminococcaceae bacterium]|nr:stage V sporulation protein AC [Oscillospiraceae bacterium]